MGTTKDSFALTTMHVQKSCCGEEDSIGGLAGVNGSGGIIATSYAAGRISIRGAAYVGGLIGSDMAPPGSVTAAYWDMDKGVDDANQGAGNITNDPGITGLTDTQLKSRLPEGLDPKIWGQSPNINHGYPYLLANPPK